MRHKARFCERCGQAFHGHGLWGLCPGCKAELRRERRMMRDYEPESGYNLPAGCLDVPEPDGRTCATCRHCIEECCDYGACELMLGMDPCGLRDWYAVLDYLDGARVDMQEDFCGRWEACE